ncbi:hypothetical protein HQ560_10390, partial [bacterium]|nr:hypothetical protein [bacterium]
MGTRWVPWAMLLGLMAFLSAGAEAPQEPEHAVAYVPVGLLFGEVYTIPVVPGKWVSVRERTREVDRKIWWVYRAGRRVVLRGGDARYWVIIDDGEEKLAGIDFGMPTGPARLAAAIAGGARDLVVMCAHDAIGQLPQLPAGRGFALVVQGKGLTDLSPLSRQTGIEALAIEDCGGLTDVSALAGLTALTSLSLSDCEEVAD